MTLRFQKAQPIGDLTVQVREKADYAPDHNDGSIHFAIEQSTQLWSMGDEAQAG
jgi:hypothetical protein